MNTEHHMERMGQERPVPRFEIVHTPRLFVDDDVLAEEPNPQPWHVRFIGANGEPVWWTESYADRRDAVHAIRLLVEALLPPEYTQMDEADTFASPIAAVDVEVSS